MNEAKILARRSRGARRAKPARGMRNLAVLKPGIPVGPWTPRTKAPHQRPERPHGSPRPPHAAAPAPGSRRLMAMEKRAARKAARLA